MRLMMMAASTRVKSMLRAEGSAKVSTIEQA